MVQQGDKYGAREDGSISTRDGARIAYSRYRGEGKGRIVLVHSLAMDRHFWDAVVAELGAGMDVLVYDCRGHGASDKPDTSYTVELFADDLADLMGGLGWRDAVVAGASMGGCVALAFATAYPDRVAGLGLIDTTAYYSEEAPRVWAERAQKAVSAGMETMVDFQTSRWFGDAFRAQHPAVVERAVDVFLANDVAAYARTCHMLGACDLRASLDTFRMPVRIAVGEEDYATPVAMAEAMKAAIPNARLTVFDGARHFTPLEVPGAVAAVLDDLCAEARVQ